MLIHHNGKPYPTYKMPYTTVRNISAAGMVKNVRVVYANNCHQPLMGVTPEEILDTVTYHCKGWRRVALYVSEYNCWGRPGIWWAVGLDEDEPIILATVEEI